MNLIYIIKNQIWQIWKGDTTLLIHKLLKLCAFPFVLLASIPTVIVIRLIRPWFLIRFGNLISNRIGHFAANTELYLCERKALINTPKVKYIDIFYPDLNVCNIQMLVMWKRLLHIWPRIVVRPVQFINKCIPGWQIHEVNQVTQSDRDIHNLLLRFPAHLEFTHEENVKGQLGLAAMGISQHDRFVCLLVRDNAYLNDQSWAYHSYRDSDISNYLLAADELANRGYYVIRMGAKVSAPLVSENPKVLDYASNGMRSDFMDIYLGAKCDFCLSTSSGWDAIPMIFRRPIAFTNSVPIGYFFTFLPNSLALTKKHLSLEDNKYLSLAEIFERGLGFCLHSSDYENKQIRLVENTPQEIRDLCTEFEERLAGTWITEEQDENLQKRFWEVFPMNVVNSQNHKPLHGQIHLRYSTHFLRKNPQWLT